MASRKRRPTHSFLFHIRRPPKPEILTATCSRCGQACTTRLLRSLHDTERSRLRKSLNQHYITSHHEMGLRERSLQADVDADGAV